MSEMIIHPIHDYVYIQDSIYGWLPGIVEQVKENEILVRIMIVLNDGLDGLENDNTNENNNNNRNDDWNETTVVSTSSFTNSTTGYHDNDNDDSQSHTSSSSSSSSSSKNHHSPTTTTTTTTNTTNTLNEMIMIKKKEKRDQKKQLRWVQLKDYYNHHLPKQNINTTTYFLELLMNQNINSNINSSSNNTSDSNLTNNNDTTATTTTATMMIQDLHELEYIHEAELLYQIKIRHTITTSSSSSTSSNNNEMMMINNPYIRCYGTKTNTTSSNSNSNNNNPYLKLMISINPCCGGENSKNRNNKNSRSSSSIRSNHHLLYAIQQQQSYTHPIILQTIRKQQQQLKQESDIEISAPSFDEKKEDDENKICKDNENTNNSSTNDVDNDTTNIDDPIIQKNISYWSYIQQEQLIPHIYEISGSIYYDLITQKEHIHQSIVVTGESGSGKTETIKILLQHFMFMSCCICSSSSSSNSSNSNSNSTITTNMDKPNSINNTYTAQQQHVLNYHYNSRNTPFFGSQYNNTNNLITSVTTTTSCIFEAFGNAKTIHNSNSTRFGKVTKLHYYIPPVSGTTTSSSTTTSSPTNPNNNTPIAYLIGSTYQTYMLESNRVVAAQQYGYGERNYHIFYQILSASSSVKYELLGPDWKEAQPQDFKYLNQYYDEINNNNDDSVSINDSVNWTTTLKALIVCGWDGTTLERLIRALGIILLIGNIEFNDDDYDDGTTTIEYRKHHNDPKPANITQTADLIMLSTSLGIPAVELELALTHRTIQTGQDLLLVPLSSDQAYEACMSLSKLLYTKIFETVVRQMNVLTSPTSSVSDNTSSNFYNADTLSTDGMRKTIALIDIFGFENFHMNHYEQFCINYANERLQNKYLIDNLSQHKIEYEQEGIVLPDWKHIDNTYTIELIEGITGLIKHLNDQCILPNGSSEDFVALVKQVHQNNEKFFIDKLHTGSTVFGIHHFAGPVLYDAQKFVERNTYRVPDFLINVVATSTNGIIAQELGEVMKERTVSMFSKRKNKNSVMDRFQNELIDLMSCIHDSHPRYIRCIKPCDDINVSKKVDHQVVLRQLRSAGLVSAVEQTRETYPNKLPFETVARRFSCLLSKRAATSIGDMDLIDRAQVILSSVFAPMIENYRSSEFIMPFACGHTKVFFRPGALEVLESEREIIQTSSVICIQSFIRRELARKHFGLLVKGFTKIQALCRRRVSLQQYVLIRVRIVKIQAMGRKALCRYKFLRFKCAVVSLQRWWLRVKVELEKRRHENQIKNDASLMIAVWLKGILSEQRIRLRNDSAIVISSWWAVRKERIAFVMIKEAATLIGAWIRAVHVLKKYRRMKKAANVVAYRRRLQLSVRMEKLLIMEEIKKKEYLKEQIRAVTRLQLFVRSKQRSKSRNTQRPIDGDDDLEQKRDSCRVTDQDFILEPHSIFEQAAVYKRQIEELKNDITLLTSEAELHKLEVEAEFEDRLAEYEEEVLQLKNTIDSLNEEKITLKDEIAANVENVHNLKIGIQSMHVAHREYLDKIMRAIENANREHQIALDFVRREKENKVRELQNEVDRLQRENQDRELRNGFAHQETDNIYRLARKIEKVTSPNYIAALSKKVRKLPSKEEYIEEKFSGRVRQLLYKIEDIATSPQSTHPSDEYVESLQQQLLEAKAENERLREQNIRLGNNDVSDGRRRLKKFFER